jgi:hypothetical protein
MVEPLLAAVVVVLLLCLALPPARHALGEIYDDLARRYRDVRQANHRAEDLLRAVLSAEEYSLLVERGFLDIRSPSRPNRTYRVPRDGGIVVMRERGRPIGGLCLQSVQPIPSADSVAMHKLMIEGAEDAYLQTANHLSVGALSRYGLGVLYER